MKCREMETYGVYPVDHWAKLNKTICLNLKELIVEPTFFNADTATPQENISVYIDLLKTDTWQR